MADVVADGALEFQPAALNAATQLPVHKLGEEPFDLIDPESAFGSDVQVEARIA